jgi:hypothetical protein
MPVPFPIFYAIKILFSIFIASGFAGAVCALACTVRPASVNGDLFAQCGLSLLLDDPKCEEHCAETENSAQRSYRGQDWQALQVGE